MQLRSQTNGHGPLSQYASAIFGNEPKGARRKRRVARRPFPYDRKASAARALSAAELFLMGRFPTAAKAAYCHGSNRAYVEQAVVLIQSDDQVLLGRVLAGKLPLEQAAGQVRKLVNAVVDFRVLTPDERVAFGRQIGVGAIWDEVIAPAL